MNYISADSRDAYMRLCICALCCQDGIHKRLNALNTRNEGRYAIAAGQLQQKALLLNTLGSLANITGQASRANSKIRIT